MAIDTRQEIDKALANGNRIFNDASILFKNNSWRSCAEKDIIAYEEFNKALKIARYYYRKQPFGTSDLRHLTDGHSHRQKVLLHANSFGNMLKDDSPWMYNNKKNLARRVGLTFPELPREEATMIHDDTTRYFARFHDLRKALQYSSSSDDKFDDASLRALCGYLYYEVPIPYHETRFNLFLFDNGIMWQHGLTSAHETMIRENPDRIALGILNLRHRTPAFIQNYRTTRRLIDSLFQ